MRVRTGVALASLASLLGCSDSQPARARNPTAPSALAAAAARQPDSTRDEISRALRSASGAATEGMRTTALEKAEALAHAYAEAFADSFFVRRIFRFRAASPARRRGMVLADSLRDAGRVAAGREGIPVAMGLWRESLRRANAAGDSAAHVAALYSIGAGWSVLAGGLDSATVLLREASRLARLIGDHRTAGNAMGTLGNVARDRGDLVRAVALYDSARALRPHSGDSRGAAADENNLGLIEWSLGDLAAARQSFERALEINRSAGRDRPAAVNLTNLGDLASIAGEYSAAQSYYERALALNRTAGDVAETAFVLHGLGSLAARRGAYDEAAAALREALAIHERSGAVLDAIAVRSDLAAVEAAMGDLEAALLTLTRASDDAISEGSPATVLARLALARADIAVQIGSFAEAEADYIDAGQLFADARDDAGRAEAQRGRALLMYLRRNYDDALALLDLAVRPGTADTDSRAIAMTSLLIAEVRRETGDTAEARAQLTAANETFVRLGDVGGATASLSLLGDLARQRGAPVAAESYYRKGLGRLGDRAMPDVRSRLHAGLAEALRDRGALGAAAIESRAAIAAIEEVAAGLTIDERRAGFLADKWQIYASLARLEYARGQPVAAFAVSERMRARQMLALLDRGRVRTRAEPTQREQDLRRRIGELTLEIASASPDDVGLREAATVDPALGVALESLDAAQKQYASLLVELRQSEPDYAGLIEAEPVDWRVVAQHLDRDQVLLEYLLADSASTVFVVSVDTVAAVDLNAGRQQIADLVEFARYTMNRPERTPAGTLWRGPLNRLHELLIAPVERAGLLTGKDRLVIVPHAELHFLPFGALRDSTPAAAFLLQRFEVAYTPSASVWIRGAQPARTTRPTTVLALAPHTARLPATKAEVNAIRIQYGASRTTVLSGAAASERAVVAAASHYRILHLATYGVLNKHNPLFSYVELAAEGVEDGRLEVHEVFELELDGQLIVLSACQTAVGSGTAADVPPGDDWVGLIQAFLHAGAGTVVASLWPVDDYATARLMQWFYRALAHGSTEAEALAIAQRRMIEEDGYTHPFYWAGFILNGTR